MIRRIILFITFFLFLSACSLTSRLKKQDVVKRDNAISLSGYCDSVVSFNNLYISKIDADFTLEEEKFEARLSVLYIPDSVLYVSAVSSGFEVVRFAITPDSSVYLNKIDKIAVIYKESHATFPAPVDFLDIDVLFNRNSLCKLTGVIEENGSFILDRSSQDIKKMLVFSSSDIKIENFEFFQKKTGEYIIGKRLEDRTLEIYSNFIMDDLNIIIDGGVINYNKDVEINWDVNPRKYSIIYL